MKRKFLFHLFNYVLVSLGVCCFHFASAQPVWKSKGLLYDSPFLTVEIEYVVGDNPCSAGGSLSQYRYHITKLKPNGEYYINWRFDYFNCDHQLKTQANSLHVVKGMKTGMYITPPDNQFSALKFANYINDVKKSPGLPEAIGHELTSIVSIEPKAINGKLTINKGEATTLTFFGGYLGRDTSWQWYENDCNGRLVGTGNTITVAPKHSTIYALRAVGVNPTTCITATVTVADISLAAEGIAGKSQLCEGETNVLLTVSGGQLADGAKWVWYQDNCGGKAIGVGNNIYVSPTKNTFYYVRAEGIGGNTTCQGLEVTVVGKSKPADGIDGPDKVGYGNSVTLDVRGGKLAAGATWVWYSGNANNKVEVIKASSLTVSSIYADQIYYVRAEGPCFNSEYVMKTVRVTEKPRPTPAPAVVTVFPGTSAKFFINGGVVANDPSQLSGNKNYVATIGGGKNIGWYLRAKISGDQSKVDYETTGTQIVGYNLPGYYQYNTKTIDKRAAYTGGIYVGGTNLAVYIGGGYGTLELIYGIDEYRYNPSFYSGSAWVKNTAYSYTGAEIEGGLIIKASYFNIMGGVSTIQGKYTDYNLGIGFNF